MDRETLLGMSDEDRIDYINGRLANGEDYEAILAEFGLTKKDAGQSAPYGLGLIKIGNEVRLKPGRGDNGFAW